MWKDSEMDDLLTFEASDSSLEHEIDVLIGLVVSGKATKADWERYHALSQVRIENLQPPWVERALSKRRDSRRAA